MAFDKKAYMKAYSQRPEFKAQRAGYRANLKNKLKTKEYASSDKAKARRRELYSINKGTEKAIAKQKRDSKNKWEKQKDTRANLPEETIRTIVRNRMWYSARLRTRASGVEFSIEKEDICFGSHCPMLGVEFTLFVYEAGKRGANPYSPSLDRIDNAKGYVKGNVRVISYKANVMKSNATLDEFLLMANNWKKLEAGS